MLAWCEDLYCDSSKKCVNSEVLFCGVTVCSHLFRWLFNARHTHCKWWPHDVLQGKLEDGEPESKRASTEETTEQRHRSVCHTTYQVAVVLFLIRSFSTIAHVFSCGHLGCRNWTENDMKVHHQPSEYLPALNLNTYLLVLACIAPHWSWDAVFTLGFITALCCWLLKYPAGCSAVW